MQCDDRQINSLSASPAGGYAIKKFAKLADQEGTAVGRLYKGDRQFMLSPPKTT
jgi:hypothetical protein